MSIQNALNAALYTRLAGTVTAAGSAVYYQQAPDGAARPYIVFDYTAELDENETSNRTKNVVAFIRAFADAPAQAGTIDAQIDSLLHMQALTVTGYTNFWIARDSGYDNIENAPAGNKVYSAGAEYRIRLDKN